MPETTINTDAAASTTNKLAIFGEGKYSSLGKECYRDAQKVLRVDEATAQKIALQIMKDWGAYMAQASVTKSSVSFGKVNKDGKVTLREAASKIKGATLTYSLFILRALCFADSAAENGYEIYNTQWVMSERLQECVDHFVS